MSKTKRYIASFLLGALGIFCFAMAGCGIFGSNDNNNNTNNTPEPDPVTVNIESAEDFSKIKYDSETPFNVVLQNDIDLDDIPFSTVVANSKYTNTLDGNGHTISNVLIMGKGVSGLFSGFSEISNLNVESAQVTISETSSDGRFGLITSSGGEISNCTVKDASITVSKIVGNGRIGAIAGYVTEISKCSVEDLTMNITTGDNPDSLSAGGIAGSAKTISECSAENLEIYASGERNVYIGGVAGKVTNGEYTSNATDLSAKNIKVDANLKIGNECCMGGVTGILDNYSISSELSAEDVNLKLYSITGKIYGTPAYIGGVTGKMRGSLSKAYSDNANISAECYDKVFGGGISGTLAETGTISNSYSLNTTIDLKTPSGSAKDAYGGGITSLANGTINNAYSYKTKITVNCGGNYYVGGIAGHINGGVISYCASIGMSTGSLTGTTYVQAVKAVAPIGYNEGSIAHCYYANASASFTTTNDLTASTLNKELFTESLKLSDKNWDFGQFDDDEIGTPLPVLK